MSAYVVSDKHIDAIMQWASKSRSHPSIYGKNMSYDSSDQTRVGQILIDENYRSVNYRYKEGDKPHKYRYTSRNTLTPTPIQILKLLQALDYQCCETNDWRESEAYYIVQSLMSRAIHDLPGYEEAEWSI